jgi:hypothetical protein
MILIDNFGFADLDLFSSFAVVAGCALPLDPADEAIELLAYGPCPLPVLGVKGASQPRMMGLLAGQIASNAGVGQSR